MTLANDVLKMVQETDVLIDDLPGLDKTEAYVFQLQNNADGSKSS